MKRIPGSIVPNQYELEIGERDECVEFSVLGLKFGLMIVSQARIRII